MSSLLKADAQFALNQYRTGIATDPYTLLDSHRLFAVELLCDGAVTGDDVRESIHDLIAALNGVTDFRKTQPVNAVLS